MRNWIVAALVIWLVVGCASTDTQSPAPVDEAAPAAAGAAGPGGASTSGVSNAGVSGAPGAPGAWSAASVPALRDPRNVLSKRVIQFDFDSFVVKDEYRPLVEAHAKFLQTNKPARLTLQGHADERGSHEYNIALGQKRAEAVKNLMMLLGATEIQVETVSFGKEKPKAEGHNESAWAQNRRVEIVYVGE